MKLRILLVAALAVAGSIGAQTYTGGGATGVGVLMIVGNDFNPVMTCKTPIMEGDKLAGVKDCVLESGHTLDEAMTIMVKQQSETSDRFDSLLKQYQDSIAEDFKAFKEIQRELKKAEQELNHGIPLSEGPRT